jgi:hypothetical protein
VATTLEELASLDVRRDRERRRLEWLGAEIVSTAPHFGGSRPWMLCPECGRRCAIVYSTSPDDETGWACRVCVGLPYAVDGEPRWERSARAARKARERLDGGPGLLGPLPPKPAFMWWTTYARLCARAEVAEWAALAPFGIAAPPYVAELAAALADGKARRRARWFSRRGGRAGLSSAAASR